MDTPLQILGQKRNLNLEDVQDDSHLAKRGSFQRAESLQELNGESIAEFLTNLTNYGSENLSLMEDVRFNHESDTRGEKECNFGNWSIMGSSFASSQAES